MKIYGVPDDVHVPDFSESFVNGSYDRRKDDEITEKFYAELEAKLRDMGYDKKRTGRIVRFPIADGMAQYMVAEGSKTILVHLPLHDAYSIPEAHARGLRVADIRRMVDAKRLFGETR